MNFRRFLPVFAAALAPFFAATTAAAQAAPAPAPSASATRYVWTGVTLDANGARIGPAPVVTEVATTYGDGAPALSRVNPRATADAHLQALAELELALALDRDLAKAQRALDELWARAAWREEYHGRFEVLQELALARARLAERRGAQDETRAALAQLLPGDALKLALGARFEFEPASDALLAAERTALASPAFVQKAATGGGAPDERPWEKGVEATVRANFGTGTAEILSLGALAAPALEKILLEAPDSIFRADLDPLGLLVQVARVRAGGFLRANVNAGGLIWHRRILRALEDQHVMMDAQLWTFRGTDLAPALNEPVWAELFDALCDDVDARLELITALKQFALHDALTPKMQATLLRALEGRDGPEAQAAAAELLQRPAGEATVRTVAEEALRSRVVEARRAAARWLVNEERSDALLAAAGDSDTRVREFVVAALGARNVEKRDHSPNIFTTKGRYLAPVLGTRERELLVALAADPEVTVRRQVAFVAAPLAQPLAADLYTRLAEDEDQVVRTRLVEGLRSDNPSLAVVLDRASRSADAEMFTRIDKRLADLARDAGEREDAWFTPYMPTFLRRLEHGEIPVSANLNNEYARIFSAAAFVPGGLNELTRRVVASDTSTWLDLWAQGLKFTRRGRNTEAHPAFAQLDGVLLQRAFRRYFAFDAERAAALADVLQRTPADPGHHAAWKALLLDRTADTELRLVAATLVASAADDDCDVALLEVLAQLSSSTQRVKRALRALGSSYAPNRAEALGLAVVGDSRLTTDQVYPLLDGLYDQGKSTTWATAALTRWMDSTEPTAKYVLNNALACLPASDAAETVAYLDRAVQRPALWRAAILAMGRMKKAIYLDMLAAEFASPTKPESFTEATKQLAVAEAIASYLTEDAAERLLRGVPLAVNQDVRAQMLASLEQVRAYLDAKKRWNARASDADKRAEAVSSLVKLCDDPDPATRAQAAKGLAALDALEHLPKLIALLKDKSPDVRAAAQQALDVLNTRAAAPATPPK